MRSIFAFIAISLSCGAQNLPFPSKAEWTATPGVLRQVQGKYPGSVNVVLYLNNCRDNSGTLQHKLAGDSVYQIVGSGAGITATAPTVGDCTLTTTLTIDGSAQPGNQFLVVNEKANGKTDFISMGAAMLAMMDATAGPTPSTPEVDVLWDVISQHVCSDSFGNHVPKYLYCIEVKIGNNSSHSLQLAGVGFKVKHPFAGKADIPGDARLISPNTAYQTTRSVLQAGQGTTARNLIYNITKSLGLIMASFTPYFHNANSSSKWSTGAAIVSGAFVQTIDLVAPDLTVRELNNLDDQSFRDGKLIPNNTQVRMIVFVDKELIAGTMKERCTELLTVKSTLPSDVEIKKCTNSQDPTIIKVLLGDLVLVGDSVDYLQRVVVDTSVTSQEVAPAVAINASSADSTSKLVTLGGAGLDGITSISVDGTVVPAENYKNKTSSQIQFTSPKSLTKGTASTVEVQSTTGKQAIEVTPQ